jgi:F-BAR domain only protein
MLISIPVNEVRQGGLGGLSTMKRLGTVLGRRRQSVYGRPPSPDKSNSRSFGGFGRKKTGDTLPPVPSPRASVNNLPPSPGERTLRSAAGTHPSPSVTRRESNDQRNGDYISAVGSGGDYVTSPGNMSQSGETTDTPRQIPTPSLTLNDEPARDSEGFVNRPPANDAISQAMQEAAEYVNPLLCTMLLT